MANLCILDQHEVCRTSDREAITKGHLAAQTPVAQLTSLGLLLQEHLQLRVVQEMRRTGNGKTLTNSLKNTGNRTSVRMVLKAQNPPWGKKTLVAKPMEMATTALAEATTLLERMETQVEERQEVSSATEVATSLEVMVAKLQEVSLATEVAVQLEAMAAEVVKLQMVSLATDAATLHEGSATGVAKLQEVNLATEVAMQL